jgi:hypothetical protein
VPLGEHILSNNSSFFKKKKSTCHESNDMNLISLWDRFDTKSHDFNKKTKKQKKNKKTSNLKS